MGIWSAPSHWRVALPAGVFVAGAGLQVALSSGPEQGDSAPVLAATVGVLSIPVLIGCLVGWRAPGGPVGAALAWVGATPSAVFAIELWGQSDLSPAERSGPVEMAVTIAGLGALLAVLGAAVLSLVVRYRRGDEVTRLQLRWLLLGAGTVPVLLACGWVAQSWGASPGVAYTGFLLAMLAAVPAAVAVAVLRYDLLTVPGRTNHRNPHAQHLPETQHRRQRRPAPPRPRRPRLHDPPNPHPMTVACPVGGDTGRPHGGSDGQGRPMRTFQTAGPGSR